MYSPQLVTASDRPASIAAVAAVRCRQIHGHRPSITNPACGDCLELAARLDAEVAAELEIDTAPLALDLFLVDEVAIRRALTGDRVNLSPYEWHVVVRLLSARLSPGQITHRLQFSGVRVFDSLGAYIHPADRKAAVPPIPSDHVEDVVVEARLAGTPVRLTAHELNAACQHLAERGLSKKAIARRLDVRHSTVTKALRSRRDDAVSSTVSVLHRAVKPTPVSPLLRAA